MIFAVLHVVVHEMLTIGGFPSYWNLATPTYANRTTFVLLIFHRYMVGNYAVVRV